LTSKVIECGLRPQVGSVPDRSWPRIDTLPASFLEGMWPEPMQPETKDRAKREAEFYDGQKLQRDGFEVALTYLNDGIGRLRRNDAIRAAMQEATGRRVLEIGSQSWEWCLYRYGYRPQQLTCINISQAELEIGRAQATKLGFSGDFRKMDAHNLYFADGSLDLVFGVAILHHLDFTRALHEIHRVLREGGKIMFVEPLRNNPVARLVRWLTPHARTPDELPLGRSELGLIDRNFEVDNYYSELFTVLGAMIGRPFFKNPINPLARLCDFVDDRLIRMAPVAAAYYRSVVIRGTKKAGAWRY
jgi:SAM-dependent methyltransferase